MTASKNDDWTAWIDALVKAQIAQDGDSELSQSPNQPNFSDAMIQANQLISAVDKGGIPTDPIRINNIARALGLEVPTAAPMEETIARIRLTIKPS